MTDVVTVTDHPESSRYEIHAGYLRRHPEDIDLVDEEHRGALTA